MNFAQSIFKKRQKILKFFQKIKQIHFPKIKMLPSTSENLYEFLVRNNLRIEEETLRELYGEPEDETLNDLNKEPEEEICRM